ncbi:RraA family protein [Paenalcaligenes niemegkensis]|uniref:RraA family protein n=1 Tax=Paenalcaligenes niemegkensis TaxID=2895469 RepID=UPI001EE936E9|nr:RraA family protein [Paenalcaligenes niemegkensis]MCQ9618233.1 RraA family protein [Paenalcaligenes niemegkensis]
MTAASSFQPIIRDITRVSPDVIELARSLPAAILADVLGRRGTAHGRIKPLSQTMRVVGPAVTVEVRPGDNLMFHAALAIAQPGDVIVVDGKGDQTSALCGGIMAFQASESGIAGFVVDAAVRDAEEICAAGFPVFSVGTNPSGPTKGLGGLVNHPISMGGVSVNPGDLIVGDADGVVVIPRDRAAELMALGQKKLEDEASRMEKISEGDLRSAWLEPALRQMGILDQGSSL